MEVRGKITADGRTKLVRGVGGTETRQRAWRRVTAGEAAGRFPHPHPKATSCNLPPPPPPHAHS